LIYFAAVQPLRSFRVFFLNYGLLNDAVTALKFITNSVRSRVLEKRLMSQITR
jgi:hypothetical protein